MPDLDMSALVATMNEDSEFRLNARFWNGKFRLVMAGQTSDQVEEESRDGTRPPTTAPDVVIYRVVDGVVTGVDLEPTAFDSWDFSISGPVEGWDLMLEAEPRPFYQDVWSAQFWHGFKIEGDLEQFYAYHPAIRRMTQLMRGLVKA